MCRAGDLVRAALAGIFTAGTAAAIPPESADAALEAYLRDAGLRRLLAEQLSRRVEEMPPGPDRVDLASELAGVYTELLAESDSLAEQERWETRGRELIALVPDAESIDLRLGLARASYARHEEIAERWLLRMASETERAVAQRRLGEIEARLSELSAEAHQRVAMYERREESGSVGDPIELTESLTESRRQRSMSHYLAGWASYYVAELSEQPGAAREAIVHLGWLLNAEPGTRPTLDRLPTQTLKYEHVARAALATAMCLSLEGNDAEALAWLDVIDAADGLPVPVAEQMFAKRLRVLARAGWWTEAYAIVGRYRDGEPIRSPEGSGPGYDEPLRSAPESPDHSRPARPLPPLEARLAAVLAFEALGRADVRANDVPRVETLRDVALGDLVARGELGHVLDLASRYGAASFGDATFVSHQVRGLRAYRAARDAHAELGDADGPVTDAEVGQMYRDAAEQLGFALRSADAVRFPEAIASTAMLLGLSLYYAGVDAETGDAAYVEAASIFEDAARRLDDADRSANALWMAIRSLDLEIEATDDPAEALVLRRDRLVEQFLERHGGHERAAALMLRGAMDESLPPDERIALLLDVPPGSPLAETARRHAARIAYAQYRAASGDDQDFLAGRYAGIAEPLLVVDRRRASAGDLEAAERASVRARRLAETALAMRVPDVDRAERALDVLASLVAAGLVDGEELAAEIDFRHAQLALARGDLDEAERRVEALRDRDDRFASAANRLFFRDAVVSWTRLRSREPASAETLDLAARVLRTGVRLAEELDADPTGETADARTTLDATIAAAAQALWEHRGDEAARTTAIAYHERVLAARPNDARALRGFAETAEAAGRLDDALRAWRTLLAGLTAGSSPWFEARFRQLALLERSDPDRAREVLAQHVVLYPELGPTPWGERIAEMAGRLGIAAEGDDR